MFSSPFFALRRTEYVPPPLQPEPAVRLVRPRRGAGPAASVRPPTATCEPRLRRPRPAQRHAHADARPDQARHVADALGQPPRPAPAVPGRGDRHLDPADERPVLDDDLEPLRPHAVGEHAVPHVGADVLDGVGERPALVGREADRLRRPLVGPPDLDLGRSEAARGRRPFTVTGRLAPRATAASPGATSRRKGAGGAKYTPGAMSRARRPAHGRGRAEEEGGQQEGGDRRPPGRPPRRPEGVDPLEGDVLDLAAERVEGRRVEPPRPARGVAVGEVEERREPVVDARVVPPRPADDGPLVEAGQHAGTPRSSGTTTSTAVIPARSAASNQKTAVLSSTPSQNPASAATATTTTAPTTPAGHEGALGDGRRRQPSAGLSDPAAERRGERRGHWGRTQGAGGRKVADRAGRTGRDGRRLPRPRRVLPARVGGVVPKGLPPRRTLSPRRRGQAWTGGGRGGRPGERGAGPDHGARPRSRPRASGYASPPPDVRETTRELLRTTVRAGAGRSSRGTRRSRNHPAPRDAGGAANRAGRRTATARDRTYGALHPASSCATRSRSSSAAAPGPGSSRSPPTARSRPSRSAGSTGSSTSRSRTASTASCCGCSS